MANCPVRNREKTVINRFKNYEQDQRVVNRNQVQYKRKRRDTDNQNPSYSQNSDDNQFYSSQYQTIPKYVNNYDQDRMSFEEVNAPVPAPHQQFNSNRKQFKTLRTNKQGNSGHSQSPQTQGPNKFPGH